MTDQPARPPAAQDGATLKPLLSSPEVWSFGLTGLLYWILVAPGAHDALGNGAFWVWVPVMALGILINMQVRQLAAAWPEMSGGTANYISRLFQHGWAGRYLALAYYVGWAATPAICSIVLTDLIVESAAPLGLELPVLPMRLLFCLLPFGIAFAGIRAQSILHLVFLLPATGLLLLFAVQGAAWLAVSPASPGFFPAAGQGIGFIAWAKWFVICAYAAYALDTSASFARDAQNPATILHCLKAVAAISPIVLLGASWVLMRLSDGTASYHDHVFLNLSRAAARFWGEAADEMVMFIVVSILFVAAATSCANAPRILYQLARDGTGAPVLGTSSRRNAPGPALLASLAVALGFLAWGDVNQIVGSTAVAYLLAFVGLHLGLWRQRREAFVLWPQLSLVVFLVEAVVVVVGGLALGWALALAGLLLPVALLLGDALIRRVRLRWLQVDWWTLRYRSVAAPMTSQVASVIWLIGLVMASALAGWGVKGFLDRVGGGGADSLVTLLVVIACYAAVAMVCWIALPMISSIDEARDRAEAQASYLMTNALDAIMVVDQLGAVRAANPAAADLFGSAQEALVGRNFDALIPGAKVDFSVPRSEHVLPHRDGSVRTVELAVSEIGGGSQHNEHGVILHDVTERIVAARALGVARDAAEAATREKAEFLANMSHEIRTPLNGMIGMVGLLLQTPLTDRQRHYAGVAVQSGETLLAVINDVLDYSKIEARQMRIENIPFDLRLLMEDIVVMLSEGVGERDVDCLVDMDPALPQRVVGDPLRLTQVLSNLGSNAVKFTERGEVVMRARRVSESANTVLIRFEVSDTGIGMDAQQQQRIFRPFAQADSSTTRKYGGTGLGLVIAKEIVEHVGGEMGFQSAAGQGSLFWFTAPFPEAPVAQDPEAATVTDLSTLHVLVVDDNPVSLSIMQELMDSWRMRATTATDAGRALELMRTAADRGKPFDLVFVEAAMPNLAGLDLARAIKDDKAISAARLILLARGGSNVVDRHGALDVAAWLEKPVRQSSLYDCLVHLTVGPVAKLSRDGQAAPMAGGADLGQAGAHLKLLVAEDNLINQQVVAGMLAARGYAVEIVGNGLEAVAAVERGGYDAVLMDCQMPTMDGYTAAQKIRSLPGEVARIPIIAVTAHALAGEREKCLAAGMDDYIAKPLRAPALYQVIERWTADRDVSSSPRVPRLGQTGSGDLFDPSVLEDLRALELEGETGLVGKVVGTFLRDTPARIEQLRHAALGGDGPGLRALAHLIKGSGACVGALTMVECCERLEQLSDAGLAEGASDLVHRLDAEYRRVRDSLERPEREVRPS